MIDDLEVASRAVRFQRAGLKVDGVPFDLRQYPFLIEPFDTIGTVPRITVRKGAQLGFTVMWVMCTIDTALYLYPRGILYLMPTRDDVHDFSRSRFDRLLKDNWDKFGQKVKGTDSMSIKRIGNAFVYFRGAKSRSQLKSIPCDALTMDERDEMDPAQVELARHRLDGSEFKHESDFSTPTVPGYGVDLTYSNSDQRMWHVKCEACGAWTCLEATFPDTLIQTGERTAIRACSKCKKELNVAKGQWVAAHPDRSADHVGYYVSQLCSPRQDPYRILMDFEEAEAHGGEKLKEFRNSRLGLAHADLEDLLTEQMLQDACGPDASQVSAQGPCMMGVDIGKTVHHYVIGERVTEQSVRVVRYGQGTYEQLHDLWERFNIQTAVLDEMAETHSVRNWIDEHRGAYGCWYSESQRTDYAWDAPSSRVTVNRTESLDASHALFTRSRCILPRAGEGWKEFVAQMCNIARVTIRDQETGMPKTRWVVRGTRKNDHYRHAFNYMVLAAERTSVAEKGRRIITPSEFRGTSWMSG